jgi:hypothetical protein
MPDWVCGMLDESVGCLDRYVGCLDGYVGCPDGHAECLDGYVGCLDGHVGCLNGILDAWMNARNEKNEVYHMQTAHNEKMCVWKFTNMQTCGGHVLWNHVTRRVLGWLWVLSRQVCGTLDGYVECKDGYVECQDRCRVSGCMCRRLR